MVTFSCCLFCKGPYSILPQLMCTSESVLVACIPTRWQYIMNEMPLSSISYGHALGFFFPRCVKLAHPVDTQHKKRAVSHLCMHRLCLAVGMCAHTVLYSSSALKSSKLRPGQIIQWYTISCMPVLPPRENQKIMEMSYWYELRQIFVNTSLKKPNQL